MGGSIGGKVAATTDLVPAPTLADAPFSTLPPNWGGYGTDIGPLLYDQNPQGANDGSANSAAIINALTTNFSSPPYNGISPVPLSDYAAGLCSTLSVDSLGIPCTAPNICYTDWYLPAICELGLGNNTFCITTNTTIQEQLFSLSAVGLIDGGFYWSSSQLGFSGAAETSGSGWLFDNTGSSAFNEDKRSQLGVRCARELTL